MMDPSGDSGEPPPPAPVSAAEFGDVLKYIRAVALSVLDVDGTGPSALDKALENADHTEHIKKFISDAQTKAIMVYRTAPKEDENEGDNEDGAPADVTAFKPIYTVDSVIQFMGPKYISVGFLKRGQVVEADKKVGMQIRVINFECSLPFETLHSYVSNAVAPFFKSYVRRSGKSDSGIHKMPDSPAPNTVPVVNSVAPVSSPASSHSSSAASIIAETRNQVPVSGTINGTHSASPTRSLSPGLGNQLPPTCGARQLSKLKRFLTTLQQFGSDISPEIGERVRNLIVNLVNNAISVEEFHKQLQDATNFPLRPFVIPFLKANLPLLQQELLQCSQMAKQSPHQYLSQHEALLHERDQRLITEPDEFVATERSGDKRKMEVERPKENGLPEVGMSPSKRSCPAPGYDMDGSMLAERLMESIKQDSDDWRNVETMLQCVMSIIEKAKRAVSVLQERCIRDREEMASWARRMADEAEAEVKRRAADLMAKTLKQTEDRISDVKRRAEEAVSDVKRQAVVELQRAVCAAEEKANEALAQAHQRMEKAVIEARRQATEETLSVINHQENSRENCWNCGRKANETCSGCNVARYCGAFCQHKDWENHHKDCGKHAVSTSSDSTNAKSPKSVERIGSPDKRSTSSSSPPATTGGATRTTTGTPVSSGNGNDPITSLSDYVRKTPTT